MRLLTLPPAHAPSPHPCAPSIPGPPGNPSPPGSPPSCLLQHVFLCPCPQKGSTKATCNVGCPCGVYRLVPSRLCSPVARISRVWGPFGRLKQKDSPVLGCTPEWAQSGCMLTKPCKQTAMYFQLFGTYKLNWQYEQSALAMFV